MKAIFAAVIASIFGVAPATAASADPTTVTHPQWSRNAVIYEVNVRQYTPEGTSKPLRVTCRVCATLEWTSCG